MSSAHRYTIVIRPDDSTSGCDAIGRTPAEAQAELVHVFKMIEEEYAQERRPLPRTSPVSSPMPVWTGRD
jgi:predicted RNase H-like HicB family nuclease